VSSLSHESSANPFEPPGTGTADMARAPADAPLAEVDFQRLAAVLVQTRPWVRVMSVLLFLSCVPLGLLILIELARSVTGAKTPFEQGESFGNALAHGLMIAMLFFPARYLWLYARRIDEFAGSGRLTSLADALDAQRKYWKLVAILACVFVGLMLLIVAAGVMAVVMRQGA